ALIAERIGEARKAIEAEAVKQAAEALQSRMAALEEDRNSKDRQLKEVRERELALLREKTALESQRRDFELESEKKLLESRREIEDQAVKKEREIYELKLLELQKKLEVQTHMAQEMQRKAEQGSMQLQGEVQELALEALLKASFPFDEVLEVAKGKKGADCLLLVRNNLGQECGKIVFESKRTQAFAENWIAKVKQDMQIVHADMAVIVTQAKPKKMDETFIHQEGVWICSFGDVRSLTIALRDGLLRVQQVSRSHENRGEKMQLLYSYLTSNEFSQQWNAIREGFRIMQQSIGRERDAMEKLWKAREKQLEKVLLNAAHIRGSIEGIAGSDVVDIRLLEDEHEEDPF
ncbi:MAG TPA: DUF2130 domain-containing protein, partial [Chitinophagaceae bacterium]|nr:DUF2130 domain-containing protein [Chitinophagaceae bacterium]